MTPIIPIYLLLFLLSLFVLFVELELLFVIAGGFVFFFTEYYITYLLYKYNYLSVYESVYPILNQVVFHSLLTRFLLAILIVFVFGFIYSSLNEKPIKSYILDYLQDNPNLPNNETKLQKEFNPANNIVKADDIKNSLIQLSEENKIIKIEELNHQYYNHYYFPYYTFKFINYDCFYLIDFLYNCLNITKTTDYTSPFQSLRDLEVYIINELCFNPKKNDPDNRQENTYRLPPPPKLKQLANHDFHLLRYRVNNNNITVDFNTIGFNFCVFEFRHYQERDVITKIVNLLCILNKDTQDTNIRGLQYLQSYIINTITNDLLFKPTKNIQDIRKYNLSPPRELNQARKSSISAGDNQPLLECEILQNDNEFTVVIDFHSLNFRADLSIKN
ncbi:MAG: hypothetical protein QNJ54_16410 [Prochloraceae cyanobacterium]|nr:hypothetical protein [Prochloraceae cyanobacterium]